MIRGILRSGLRCGMGGCTCNQASDLIAEADPNATEFSYTYDRLSRRTEARVDLVSPGSGAAATHDGNRVTACVHCLDAAAAGPAALLSAAGRRGGCSGISASCRSRLVGAGLCGDDPARAARGKPAERWGS